MKKKFFPIATMLTTFVIMTKKFFFVAATFTMPWLALCRLCSGYKKNILGFISALLHNVLVTTEDKLIFIPKIRSLRDKLSGSIRFVQPKLISPSGISVESYFVHATLISPSSISVES